MNFSAAEAFNGFILEAKQAFDRVFNREVTEEELEQIKATYTVTEIERYRAEFDAELLANYKEYSDDEELIHAYIEQCLEPVIAIEFKQTNTEILNNKWEVSYLVHLKKAIIEQWNYIYSLLIVEKESHFDEIIEDVIEFITYPHLNFFCKRLLATENCIDEQDKLISVANMPPNFDSRFDFEMLQIECERLSTITDSIKLITKRLFEFKQWKIQNHKLSNGIGGFSIIDYGERYYPNFEDLCRFEVEKLQSLDAIEKSAQAKETPEIQSKTTVGLSASDYVWKSSATDMLELVTALYQNKSIERRDGKPLTRKELTGYFQQLFEVKIADVENNLSIATNRKLNLTPFLNNLAVQFENYVAGKEAKMLKRR